VFCLRVRLRIRRDPGAGERRQAAPLSPLWWCHGLRGPIPVLFLARFCSKRRRREYKVAGEGPRREVRNAWRRRNWTHGGRIDEWESGRVLRGRHGAGLHEFGCRGWIRERLRSRSRSRTGSAKSRCRLRYGRKGWPWLETLVPCHRPPGLDARRRRDHADCTDCTHLVDRTGGNDDPGRSKPGTAHPYPGPPTRTRRDPETSGGTPGEARGRATIGRFAMKQGVGS
jgi:hypothetical protein